MRSSPVGPLRRPSCRRSRRPCDVACSTTCRAGRTPNANTELTRSTSDAAAAMAHTFLLRRHAARRPLPAQVVGDERLLSPLRRSPWRDGGGDRRQWPWRARPRRPRPARRRRAPVRPRRCGGAAPARALLRAPSCGAARPRPSPPPLPLRAARWLPDVRARFPARSLASASRRSRSVSASSARAASCSARHSSAWRSRSCSASRFSCSSAFAHRVGFLPHQAELLFESRVGLGAHARDLGFERARRGFFGLPAHFFSLSRCCAAPVPARVCSARPRRARARAPRSSGHRPRP